MKEKMSVNRYDLAKIVLLLGFSLFFLIILLTGAVSFYIHPRIEPYLIFSAVSMTLIAFLMLPRLKSRPNAKRSLWPLALFALPLLMALIFQPQSIGSASVSTSDLMAAGQSGSTDIGAQPTSDANAPSPKPSNAQAVPSEEPPQSVIASDAAEDEVAGPGADDAQTLFVTDDNFYEVLNALYEDMGSYQGKRIEMTGFVFFDPENFAPDQFVPARMLMTCCAADMVAVGVLCHYDDAATLEEDSWVKVTGTVGTTDFLGETVPYVEVESIQTTTPPDDKYIYPY